MARKNKTRKRKEDEIEIGDSNATPSRPSSSRRAASRIKQLESLKYGHSDADVSDREEDGDAVESDSSDEFELSSDDDEDEDDSSFASVVTSESEVYSDVDAETKIKTKKRKTKAKPSKASSGKISREGWEDVWAKIVKYREKHNQAACDTQGAAAVSDKVSGKDRKFEVLVGLMLSAQTKDEVTHAARNRLRDAGILNVDGIMRSSEEEIDKLIYPVGFHQTKAKRIKLTTQIIHEKFGGEVPSRKADLLSLPGVGQKMANLTLLVAFGTCEGISVDTHVHRVCNKLGWVNTSTPLNTEKELEGFVPREIWPKFNHTIVGFGQLVCGYKPKCEECPVSDLCPSSLF